MVRFKFYDSFRLLQTFYQYIFQTVLALGAGIALCFSGCSTDGVVDERVPGGCVLIQCTDLAAQALEETQQEEAAVFAAPGEFSRAGRRSDDVTLRLQEQGAELFKVEIGIGT